MCFGSRDKEEDGAGRSRDIDRLIKQDEKRMSKEVKLLLLGEFGNNTGDVRRTRKPQGRRAANAASCLLQAPANRASQRS